MPEAVRILFECLPGADLKAERDPLQQEFLGFLFAAMEQREEDLIERTASELLASFLRRSGYPAPELSTLQACLDVMYAFTQRYWQLEADTHDTLRRLRRAGFRLAVISNAMDDRNTQALIDEAQLRDYFEVILSSARAGIRKPDERIFNAVLDKMGVAAHETAMVGDTLNADILGAQAVGLYDIWIRRRADRPGNRLAAGRIQPTASIDRLDELPGLFQAL